MCSIEARDGKYNRVIAPPIPQIHRDPRPYPVIHLLLSSPAPSLTSLSPNSFLATESVFQLLLSLLHLMHLGEKRFRDFLRVLNSGNNLGNIRGWFNVSEGRWHRERYFKSARSWNALGISLGFFFLLRKYAYSFNYNYFLDQPYHR